MYLLRLSTDTYKVGAISDAHVDLSSSPQRTLEITLEALCINRASSLEGDTSADRKVREILFELKSLSSLFFADSSTAIAQEAALERAKPSPARGVISHQG